MQQKQNIKEDNIAEMALSSQTAAVLQPVVIVWEWHDQGHWMPYEPPVSNFIEQHFQQQSRYVRLGQSDPSLSHYALDLSTCIQIRQDTGIAI